MPDHVHLLVEVDPQFGVHRLVKRIKGRSSRVLREEFPWLKVGSLRCELILILSPLQEVLHSMWLRSILRVRRRYSSTYQFLSTAKAGGFLDMSGETPVASKVWWRMGMVMGGVLGWVLYYHLA